MKEQEMSQEGTRERFYEIIKGFSSGMLVTRAPEGQLRSRPMSLAEVEDGGALYFVTGLDTPKVRELEADAHVNVALQGKTQFASLSGHAEVVRDRAAIERLWSESWRVWFPEGKDDPALCLLRVHPVEGEYWDNAGAKGLRYLFEAAKAYVQGKTPETEKEQNARVQLGGGEAPQPRSESGYGAERPPEEGWGWSPGREADPKDEHRGRS